MNAKEIGRKAGRIFEYNIPNNWIFRSQEDQEDYGIDGEVELADSKDHATGFIFKAQIKGKKEVSLIEGGNTASFSLSTERLRYYMNQIEIPVVLVVVDVTKKVVFWKSLQDDDSIKIKLNSAIDKSQESVTVHIPVSNTLPENHQELINAVEDNMNWLRANALSKMSVPIERMVSKSTDDILSDMLERTKTLNFHIYNENFERLYVSGKFDDLFNLAKSVINSSTEKADTRFVSGLYIERVYLQKLGHKSEDFNKLSFDLFLYLIQIVREGKCDAPVRLYALMLMRSLLLKFSVDADFHYFLSAKIAENDALTKWVVGFSRSKIIAKAARDVEKVIHLTNRIILSDNQYVLLETLPRVFPRLAVFAERLGADGYEDNASYIYSWMTFCMELALKLAKKVDKENFLAEMIVLNASYKLSTDDAQKNIDESFELSKLIKNEEIRNSVTVTVSKIRSSLKKDKDDLTPEEELEFFQDRARSLGMDINDPEDEFGQIIKQGLLDYNPERVVKDCEHLFVFPSRAQGIPARMVGLPSAAMKWVYCLKKSHGMGGWSLDDVYISPIKEHGFKATYCDSCESRVPRSETWKWSSKWQNEQMKLHKEIISKVDSNLN